MNNTGAMARWAKDGDRHTYTGPTEYMIGWYQPIGHTWWGVFTRGRAGWCEQLVETETEARELIERRAGS